MISTRRLCVLGASFLLGIGVVGHLRADGRDDRLIDAIRRRDERAFTALLGAKPKVDVNAAQPDGSTPLSWAAHLGERGMAEALLHAGANVNLAAAYGETPLTLAAANGDGVLIKELLDAGASPSAARWSGDTPLMLAASAGSLEGVKALAQRGADVNVAEPNRKQTALMWAASEGHSDVVIALIGLGANVKAVSTGGFTPLLFSVIANDAVSVKALIAAGADPSAILPSGTQALFVALQRNNTAAVRALIDGGANVAITEARTGNTPLMIAAQQGNLAVVTDLLARKADPNARTSSNAAGGFGGARGGGGNQRNAVGAGGQTALMLAARGDHEDVMRALVAAGADPTIRTEDGSNLLMIAAAGARLKTFEYAYELDPHVDVVLPTTKTTIVHAALGQGGQGQGGRSESDMCDVIQFLADHGAALDELDAAGRTPLSIADRSSDLAAALLPKLIAAHGGTPKIFTKGLSQ